MNGSVPVSIRKSRTPNEYTSLAGVAGRPAACSGEMYAAVPSTVPASVNVPSPAAMRANDVVRSDDASMPGGAM